MPVEAPVTITVPEAMRARPYSLASIAVEVEEAIRTRRTHNAYGGQPVPRATLDELFELGSASQVDESPDAAAEQTAEDESELPEKKTGGASR